MQSLTTTNTIPEDKLYVDILHFYARQMQLLDDGLVDEWALTFLEDGVFGANAHPRPATGRAEISAAARATIAELASRNVVRRHWIGMLSAAARDDGTYWARSYALVFETPVGGQAKLHLSTVCEDILVRTNDGWQIRERAVSRDDLA